MKKKVPIIILLSVYVLFILASLVVDYQPGKSIGRNFIMYALEVITILPFVFILIGLFEVWVKRETVEKHMGEKAGMMSYLWAIILGGITIGPMLVALPVAHSLSNKGARLSVIFTYIGAAAVCRIPMTIFEASYLGIKFTVIRYAVSIPLIIVTSIIMERYLQNKNYQIKKGGE